MVTDHIYSRGFQRKVEILKAADRLLRTTSADELSVLQICTAANISRTTFYHHFTDKYAMPQWHYNVVSAQGTDLIGRTLTWYEGNYVTTLGVLEFPSLHKAFTNSSDLNAIDKYASNRIADHLIETLRDYKKVEVTPGLKFQASITGDITRDAVRQLILSDEKVPTTEFLNRLISCIPREIYHALEEPIEKLESARMIPLP